jgi:hypothetical protein
MLLTLRSLETQEKFLVPCVVLTKLFTGRLFTHNQLSKHINIYIQQATNTMLPFTSVCVCVYNKPHHSFPHYSLLLLFSFCLFVTLYKPFFVRSPVHITSLMLYLTQGL